MSENINIAKIVLKDKGKPDIVAQLEFDNTQLVINDLLVAPVLKKAGWDKVSACEIILGVNNVAVQITGYTITDVIYFSGFYNMPSTISIFQSRGTGIHIVDQKIDLLQLDCQSVLLANCQVRQLDVGLAEHSELLKSASKANDHAVLTAYKMKSVDIRDCNIRCANMFIECKNINIQYSNIDNLNLHGGFGGEIVAEIGRLSIWQHASVKTLEIHCKISDFSMKKCNIGDMIAIAYCHIGRFEIDNASITDAHNFDADHFESKGYNEWYLIEKSAKYNRKLALRAEANYHIAKINCNNEKGIDKVIGKIFGACAGYGYKPKRIVLAVLSVVIISAFLYSVIDMVEAIKVGVNIFDFSSILSGLNRIAYNLILALAAFAGQSGTFMVSGVAFWLATIEYVIGIIIFAMFANALYVRYKD